MIFWGFLISTTTSTETISFCISSIVVAICTISRCTIGWWRWLVAVWVPLRLWSSGNDGDGTYFATHIINIQAHTHTATAANHPIAHGGDNVHSAYAKRLIVAVHTLIQSRQAKVQFSIDSTSCISSYHSWFISELFWLYRVCVFFFSLEC